MRTLILTSPLIIPLAAALHVTSCSDIQRNLSDCPYLHAYTQAYSFHRRDGWEDVGISNLDYKYNSNYSIEHASLAVNNPHMFVKRFKKLRGQSKSLTGAVRVAVDATLKGIGRMEEVVITWYTGKDLQNPSCWKTSGWAPTDDSFACAVTLEGWTNRPECFKFLELCNGIKKCIFVRVVDTCAGCAKGSKHVDLTKAAFKALASLDEGILKVKMRLATQPKEWHEALWGPKII